MTVCWSTFCCLCWLLCLTENVWKMFFLMAQIKWSNGGKWGDRVPLLNTPVCSTRTQTHNWANHRAKSVAAAAENRKSAKVKWPKFTLAHCHETTVLQMRWAQRADWLATDTEEGREERGTQKAQKALKSSSERVLTAVSAAMKQSLTAGVCGRCRSIGGEKGSGQMMRS